MTPSHEADEDDPWAAARARSREDVRAAFATRKAQCPACGATVDAEGRTCPACGASLIQTRAKWRPTRRESLIAGAVAALLVTLLVVWAAGLRGDSAAEQRKADAAEKRLVAAERVRLTKLGLPRAATGPRPGAAALTATAHAGGATEPATAATPAAGATTTPAAGAATPLPAAVTDADVAATLAYRKRLLRAGEAAITADARARATRDQPRATECTPTPSGPGRDAQERDPRVARNRYECIAYRQKFDLTELEGKARQGVFGTPYWLVADYRDGALTLCQMTPKGGEAAKTLANVPVDPACRDPFRRQTGGS